MDADAPPIAELERAENPFALLIARYARQPRRFVREILGAEPDKWQADALDALAQGHTRLSVRSGHGVGKSTFLAWAIIWFIATRYPFKVGVTAPSAPQLFDVLWADVKAWISRLPPGWRDLYEITSDRIALKAAPEEAFVTARTARPERPESLAGLHSAHTMIVVDEASGVEEPIFESAAGSMSTPGAITLLAGNPVRTSGYFWRTHTTARDRWWTRRVSCIGSPRVDPAFVEDIRATWGEESAAWRVRVLGEFPLAEGDTLISAMLVEMAMSRPMVAAPGDTEIWGVDVARFGTDASCLVKRRQRAVMEPPRRWRGLDLMALTGAIVNEWHETPLAQRPRLIVVDVIGLGAGVVDRLAELKLPVQGLNVAEATATRERYVRLRDELWVAMRDWLETREVYMPADDRLRDDLVAPRYRFMSDGRLKVESKDEMRSRGIPSPDSADAIALTFAPGTPALLGRGHAWTAPLRRNIRGMG